MLKNAPAFPSFRFSRIRVFCLLAVLSALMAAAPAPAAPAEEGFDAVVGRRVDVGQQPPAPPQPDWRDRSLGRVLVPIGILVFLASVVHWAVRRGPEVNKP